MAAFLDPIDDSMFDTQTHTYHIDTTSSNGRSDTVWETV